MSGLFQTIKVWGLPGKKMNNVQNDTSRWCVRGVQRDENFHINTMAEIARQGIILTGTVETFKGEKVLTVTRKDFEEALLRNEQVMNALKRWNDIDSLKKLRVMRFKLDNLRPLDQRPTVVPKGADLRAV